MKKVLFIVSIIGLISLSSCKKEHTCKCTTSYSGTSAEYFDDVIVTTTSETKCSDLETTTTTSGLTMTTSCSEQ